MHFKNIVLLSTLMVFLMFSCKTENKIVKPGVVNITGNIQTPIAPSMVFEYNNEIKEIPLQNDGSFSHSFTLDKKGLFKLFHGNQASFVSLYLEPGVDIHMTANGTNLLQSVVFKGDFENENRFLIEKLKFEQQMLSIDQASFFSQPEDAYISATEEMKTKFVDFKKDYQKKNGVFNTNFEDIINKDIEFNIANLKMIYPQYFQYFNQGDTFTPSKDYFSFFQNLDIDNAENLHSENFKQFLPLYLDYKAGETKDTTLEARDLGSNKLTLIFSLFSDSIIREQLAYQTIKDAFSMKLGEAFAMYDSYIEVAKDPNFVNEIKALHSEWSSLKPGNKAPNFLATDIKGKEYTLESFKDKVVYIDVWATWCGPCIKEIPFLEKIVDSYHSNKNIAFLSISVDEQYNLWTKMLTDKKLKGNQLYSQGAWQSEIVKNYKIQGIPRFIIIDKEGNLVDGNAPRPSSPDLVNILNNLL